MVPGKDESPPARTRLGERARFELERFVWAAPDRLEVSGKFAGLGDEPPTAAPVLVVHGGEQAHRLPAIPETHSGPPVDRQPWRAEFAWREAPIAFESAELTLGEDIVVALPEPGARRPLRGHRVLEVRRAPQPAHRSVEGPGREAAVAVGGADRLRLHTELLAAQEEVREVRAALEQTQAELARAREDLESERGRRAADAERFRDGLAKVRESAEEALTSERSAAEQLGSDLRAAHETIEARDAAVEELGRRLEASERHGREAEQLRSEVGRLRSAVETSRADAERLLARLTVDGEPVADER